MSKYHDFYEQNTIAADALWTIWGNHGPISLTQLYEEIPAEQEKIQRELMYFINSEILIPTKTENELHLSFNPHIEWMIAVSELIQNNTKDELQFQLRETKAELGIYEDMHKTDDIDEYANQDNDNADLAQWVTAENKLKWLKDAIKLYDTLDTIFTDGFTHHGETISKTEAEKYLVNEWENTRD